MSELGYSDFDRERFEPEDRKSNGRRGEFARDRARVLHSSALRRLGAKTQVLSPTAGDFARTRLTHSLEVAQVGREMGAELGLSPDIVDMACLAHDLGHPPFGHNGETALNEWAFNIGGFEGNAQTLRLLTRIEPKVFSDNGEPRGLNLTRASLDATCKYPWTVENAVRDAEATKSVKFGVYQDDLPVFEWLRDGASNRNKCIEAQVMDFADDVAYSVHDFEDAIVSGFIDLKQVTDRGVRAGLIDKISIWNGGVLDRGQLEEAFTALEQNTYWLSSFSGSPRDLATLKNLSSSLIGTFVLASTDRTLESAQSSEVTRYRSQLLVPIEIRAQISVLKGLVSAFLMSIDSRKGFYEYQRAILTELADALLAANGKHLDTYSSWAWTGASDEIAQRRVIVDQVACLTDQSAIKLHYDLVGSKKF
ncbi:MAG: deoxyguanosinetriphosphate triphosphohydrolase [Micrococcales bacterium]